MCPLYRPSQHYIVYVPSIQTLTTNATLPIPSIYWPSEQNNAISATSSIYIPTLTTNAALPIPSIYRPPQDVSSCTLCPLPFMRPPATKDLPYNVQTNLTLCPLYFPLPRECHWSGRHFRLPMAVMSVTPLVQCAIKLYFPPKDSWWWCILSFMGMYGFLVSHLG